MLELQTNNIIYKANAANALNAILREGHRICLQGFSILYNLSRRHNTFQARRLRVHRMSCRHIKYH